jgi:uncharacterized protein with predicted RNA binding PUA domain
MRDELPRLRTVADYQFGAGAGDALFDEEVTVRHTSSGRPEQVLSDGERLVSYGTDGRFTLGLAGGRRLRRALSPPAYRVVVGDESEPFVRDGKNVFAKFVSRVDPAVRPGDEVLVVHERAADREGRAAEDLLAVGRAELPAKGMLDFESGMAVKVRDAAGPAPTETDEGQAG